MTIDEEIAAVEEVVDTAGRAAIEHFERAASVLQSDVAARYTDFLDGTVLSARTAIADAREIASGSGAPSEQRVRIVERLLAGVRESVRLMYVAMTVIEQLARPSGGPEKSAPRSCSFCGKSEGEARLVAGPAGNICEACTRLACGVLGIEPSE